MNLRSSDNRTESIPCALFRPRPAGRYEKLNNFRTKSRAIGVRNFTTRPDRFSKNIVHVMCYRTIVDMLRCYGLIIIYERFGNREKPTEFVGSKR